MQTKQRLACLGAVCSAIVLGIFAGCSSLADAGSAFSGIGAMHSSVSTFDGSKVISVDPAPLYEKGNWAGVPYWMGAKWSSATPDVVYLTLSYSSSARASTVYVVFNSLSVNLNGDIQKFDATRTNLDSSTYNTVSRTIYTESVAPVVVPMDYFRKMLNDPDVRIRISSSDGYADANFSYDRIPGGQATAKYFMLKLLTAIDAEFPANK